MAYLDLASDLPRFALSAAAFAPRPAVAWHVGPLELETILLAGRDGLSSLRETCRIDTVLHWLFGRTRPNRLADPRLEALRRYAVMARLRGPALPQAESDRLRDAGFPTGAIAEIRRLVQASVAARGARP